MSKAYALKLWNVKSWDSRGLRFGKLFFFSPPFLGNDDRDIYTYIALEKPMRIMFYKGQNYIQIIVIPKPSTFNCVLDPVPFTAETSSFDFLIFI